MMLCRRLIAHITKAIQSSPHKCFCFSSSSLTLNPLSNSFDDGVEAGSAVYRHALKFQRPGIMEWCEQLNNTASFIGSVIRPPQVVNTKNRKFGVYTLLNVRTSEHSSFRWALLFIQFKFMNCLSQKLLFWFRFTASFVLATLNCSRWDRVSIGLGFDHFCNICIISPVFSSVSCKLVYSLGLIQILNLQVKTIVICRNRDSD